VLAQNEQKSKATGKKWAMAIDKNKCREGCNDCAAACHATHNVPEIGNAKEEVKWLWNERFEHAFPESVHEQLDETIRSRPLVVLCNHCENPSCVRVCPTQATFRRDDGIVMMDYHRCTGCRYCMAACPYGARSFNFRDPRSYIAEVNPAYPCRTKGVVEKCNFCAERLAVGLMPACVTACKTGALLFGDLNEPESLVNKTLQSNHSIRRKEILGTRPRVFYLM
jgi:molybdopterin-containing oxidoreductase family iron-sulfur binding subunit